MINHKFRRSVPFILKMSMSAFGPPKSRRCRVRRVQSTYFPFGSCAHVCLYLSFSINKVTPSNPAARAPHRLATSFTRPTSNGGSCQSIILVLLPSPTQTATGDPLLEARLDVPHPPHHPLTTDVKEGGQSQAITNAAPQKPASDEDS
jgi:hypothetical protein